MEQEDEEGARKILESGSQRKELDDIDDDEESDSFSDEDSA
jgi:hypothetical protein